MSKKSTATDLYRPIPRLAFSAPVRFDVQFSMSGVGFGTNSRRKWLYQSHWTLRKKYKNCLDKKTRVSAEPEPVANVW